MHPQMSAVPRETVVKIALLKLKYDDGDLDEDADRAPRYLAEMVRAKRKYGAGDDLERDVEYLVVEMTGRSDEAVGGIVAAYLGEG